MGRPVVADKKLNFAVRMNSVERAAVEKAASSLGLGITPFVRMAAIAAAARANKAAEALSHSAV